MNGLLNKVEHVEVLCYIRLYLLANRKERIYSIYMCAFVKDASYVIMLL